MYSAIAPLFCVALVCETVEPLSEARRALGAVFHSSDDVDGTGLPAVDILHMRVTAEEVNATKK